VVNRVRGVVLDALGHTDAPFERVVQQVRVEPDASRNPIFQIIVSQQPHRSTNDPEWDLATEEVSNGGSKVDLLMVLDDRGDQISGPITYNPDLCDASTIGRMVAHWETLIASALANPDVPIPELSLLTKLEREQVLVKWNETEVEYEQELCLAELIERQVERTPEAMAVRCEGEEFSY